ncbi:MAG: FAD:protein FMN transferase [Acidobacteriota bacterium]
MRDGTGPSRILVLTLGGILAMSGAVAVQTRPPHRQTRRLMGTLCEVTIYHHDPEAAEDASTAALDEMERVDRLLSNYDPASELSTMNREAPGAPFRVSEELFRFMERSRQFFDDTAGAFDPTVGPLVRAWGFFGPQPARPSNEAIAAAKAVSGFSRVALDQSARTVHYSVPGLEFDPGGIGKGYAVDRAVVILRAHGIASALVSAGGSTLFAIGQPPGRDAWRIAIADPADVERPLCHVHVRDAAVSTSGVSRRSVREGTRQFSHIFDPRTGEPVEDMCQVTVVAADATGSDALTKAAFVLGRDAVLRLFTRLGTSNHALRLEGPCRERIAVWNTPWSGSVFGPATPNDGPAGRAASSARTR